MKHRFKQVVLAAFGTLSIAGCMAEDPAPEPEPSAPEAAPETSNRIAAAAAAAGNFHQIVNRAFNQCIDAPNGTLNVALRLAACSSSTTQQWAFVATSTPNVFNLVNQRSGFCAEVNDGTSVPGERVDQWHCDGLSSEQWVQSFRIIDGVAYQQYTHAGTSLCLDTVGGAGSALMQWNCGGGNDAQTWLVR